MYIQVHQKISLSSNIPTIEEQRFLNQTEDLEEKPLEELRSHTKTITMDYSSHTTVTLTTKSDI